MQLARNSKPTNSRQDGYQTGQPEQDAQVDLHCLIFWPVGSKFHDQESSSKEYTVNIHKSNIRGQTGDEKSR